MTKKDFDAIQNAIPREPRSCELGGGIYYKCHWIKCDEDLRGWWKYCPNCGQRIKWRGEDE